MGRVMRHSKATLLTSVQNTHDILVFYYVFVPFHIVISVVIALYLVFGFLCTTSE